MVSVLLATAIGAQGQTIDLPVATHGFDQWAGVVAKAMSFGKRNQEETLQAFKSFQSDVIAKMQEQVSHTDCGPFSSLSLSHHAVKTMLEFCSVASTCDQYRLEKFPNEVCMVESTSILVGARPGNCSQEVAIWRCH